MRFIAVIIALSLTSACMDTSGSATSDPNSPVPVPNPIILAGNAAVAAATANLLTSQGFAIATAYNGRAAGITAFCSRTADALVVAQGQGFTSQEREFCNSLKDGWGWSAMSGANGDILYIRREYADDYLARR